jgi:hypothetical protein
MAFAGGSFGCSAWYLIFTNPASAADLRILQGRVSITRQFLHQLAQKSISTGFCSRSAMASPCDRSAYHLP